MDKKKFLLSIFFIIFIVGFIVYYYNTNLKEPERVSKIYIYDEDETLIRNSHLLENFITNQNNKVVASLTMAYVSDFEENIVYGIKYDLEKYIVYTILDGTLLGEKEYSNLVTLVYEDEEYYFLTNKESLTIEDFEKYLNEEFFDIFELGKNVFE